MQKNQENIFRKSLIINHCKNPDYFDSFSYTFISKKKIELEDVIRLIIFEDPAWIRFLFKLRNILVKPFKLKTGSLNKNQEENKLKISLETGKNISLFTIINQNDEEILLELTDSHLDAWLSNQIIRINEQTTISLSTAVKFNNLIGKAYFFIIKPFHKLIIKSKLKHISQMYNNQ
jgi:hypothetical protein